MRPAFCDRPNINDPDEVDEIYTSADVPNFDDRRELCKKLEPLLGGTVEIEAHETGQTVRKEGIVSHLAVAWKEKNTGQSSLGNQ